MKVIAAIILLLSMSTAFASHESFSMLDDAAKQLNKLTDSDSCRFYFKDMICDDSEQECGIYYDEQRSRSECNECQTGGFRCPGQNIITGQFLLQQATNVCRVGDNCYGGGRRAYDIGDCNQCPTDTCDYRLYCGDGKARLMRAETQSCTSTTATIAFTWERVKIESVFDLFAGETQWLDVDHTAQFADCSSGNCKGTNVGSQNTATITIERRTSSNWRINTDFGSNMWRSSDVSFFGINCPSTTTTTPGGGGGDRGPCPHTLGWIKCSSFDTTNGCCPPDGSDCNGDMTACVSEATNLQTSNSRCMISGPKFDFSWILGSSSPKIDAQWIDINMLPDANPFDDCTSTNQNKQCQNYDLFNSPPSGPVGPKTSITIDGTDPPPKLEFGKTYNWRINTHFAGDAANIWRTSATASFTTEPATCVTTTSTTRASTTTTTGGGGTTTTTVPGGTTTTVPGGTTTTIPGSTTTTVPGGTTTTIPVTTTSTTTSTSTTTTIPPTELFVDVKTKQLQRNVTGKIEVDLGNNDGRIDINKVSVRYTTFLPIFTDSKKVTCTGDSYVARCSYSLKPEVDWINPMQIVLNVTDKLNVQHLVNGEIELVDRPVTTTTTTTVIGGTTTTISGTTTSTIPGSTTTTTPISISGLIIDIKTSELLVNKTNSIRVLFGDEQCRLDKDKVQIRYTTFLSVQIAARKMTCEGDPCILECLYSVMPEHDWLKNMKTTVIVNMSGQLATSEKVLKIVNALTIATTTSTTTTITKTTSSTSTTSATASSTTTTLASTGLTSIIPDLRRLQSDLQSVKSDLQALSEKLQDIADNRYRRFSQAADAIDDLIVKVDDIIKTINSDPSPQNKQKVVNMLVQLKGDIQNVLEEL